MINKLKKIKEIFKAKKRQVVNKQMIKLKNKGYTYRQLVEDYQDLSTIFVFSFFGNIILLILFIIKLVK